MENKGKWTITEDEKNQFIDDLTNALSALRAKANIPQDELAKLIGISRQTYGAIERKKRKMSWNTYLSLILFFDYTNSTHDMLRHLKAFPTNLINRMNEYQKNNNLDLESITGLSLDSIKEKLDERALHAIKTVIMLEYARCNKVSDNTVINAFDSINFLNKKSKD